MTDRSAGGKKAELEAGASAADSNQTSVGQVYREHAEFVWRVARRLGCPTEAAEDVVHEVFIVVHRRLSDFDPTRSMKTWLYGITRNVVLHHKRGMARRYKRIQKLPEPVPEPDLDEQLARSKAVELVESFLAGLDEDKRAVFSLWAIEGMTAPEISASLGVKVNTVYSRIRAARKRFDELVQSQESAERGEDDAQ
jgi:RNA polymerase sigma-70 factor (ECF subfamily)